MVDGSEELAESAVDSNGPCEGHQVEDIGQEDHRLGDGDNGAHRSFEKRVPWLLRPTLGNANQALQASSSWWALGSRNSAVVVRFFDEEHDKNEADGCFYSVYDKGPVPFQFLDHESREKGAEERRNNDSGLP